MATLADLDVKRGEMNTSIDDYKQAIQDRRDGVITPAQLDTARQTTQQIASEFAELMQQVEKDNPGTPVADLFSRAGLYTEQRHNDINAAWGILIQMIQTAILPAVRYNPENLFVLGDGTVMSAYVSSRFLYMDLIASDLSVTTWNLTLPGDVRDVFAANDCMIVSHKDGNQTWATSGSHKFTSVYQISTKTRKLYIGRSNGIANSQQGNCYDASTDTLYSVSPEMIHSFSGADGSYVSGKGISGFGPGSSFQGAVTDGTHIFAWLGMTLYKFDPTMTNSLDSIDVGAQIWDVVDDGSNLIIAYDGSLDLSVVAKTDFTAVPGFPTLAVQPRALEIIGDRLYVGGNASPFSDLVELSSKTRILDVFVIDQAIRDMVASGNDLYVGLTAPDTNGTPIQYYTAS